MKQSFKIGQVEVYLSQFDCKIKGSDNSELQKVADYLFDEGFVDRETPILIEINSKIF